LGKGGYNQRDKAAEREGAERGENPPLSNRTSSTVNHLRIDASN